MATCRLFLCQETLCLSSSGFFIANHPKLITEFRQSLKARNYHGCRGACLFYNLSGCSFKGANLSICCSCNNKIAKFKRPLFNKPVSNRPLALLYMSLDNQSKGWAFY